VSDEDDLVQAVLADEKLELGFEGISIVKSLHVAGEAGGSAGDGDAVVSWQAEGDMEEFIHLLAKAAIGTVDCGGGNPLGLEGMFAGEDRS
jgi:hypothetical protein